MRIVHFEIQASDLNKVAEFYKEIFGWEMTGWEGEEEYITVKTGEDSEIGINGGIGRGKPGGGFVCIVGVGNIDEYIEKIKSKGGYLIQDKRPIGDMGWVAYFKDIEGNDFGIFEPTQMM